MRVLAAAVLVLAVAGCGSGHSAGDLTGVVLLNQQAEQALARWDEAVAKAGGQRVVFAPVGETYIQIGDWEGDGAGKRLLMDGQVKVDPAVRTTEPVTADVRWADGTVRRLRTMPPAEAVRLLAPPDKLPCVDCAGLTVTAAKWTTMTIDTTRGQATVPAWEYTLAGSRVKIRQVAVARAAGVTVTPPSWDPYNSPGGTWIERASVNADGRGLIVTFTGTPKTAAEPCGEDYTTEAVESDNAVVVIVYSHRHGGNEKCEDMGATRTAPVELAAPLGERAVLEVVQGLPVAVTAGG